MLHFVVFVIVVVAIRIVAIRIVAAINLLDMPNMDRKAAPPP